VGLLTELVTSAYSLP